MFPKHVCWMQVASACGHDEVLQLLLEGREDDVRQGKGIMKLAEGNTLMVCGG